MPPRTVACSVADFRLVNANHELITRMKAKIQSVLARIWGEESDSANGALPSQPGATPRDLSPKNPEG